MVRCTFPVNLNHKCLDAPVSLLNLADPEYWTLMRGNIKSIAELVDKWEDLRSIRNLGATREEKIKKAFREYYYSSLSAKEREKFDNRFAELNGGLVWTPAIG